MEKNYANVARAADVLDYFLGRDTKGRRASYLGVANDGYVTRPDRMAPSQVTAYERGATVLRVHDVREHVEALAVASAVAG